MLFFDHNIIFGSLTNLFLLGWLSLLVACFLKADSKLRHGLLIAGGRVIPLTLLLYFVIGYFFTRHLPGGMTTFDAVLTSFSVPEKVLLAWFEVIGLALLIGRWIIDDAQENQIHMVVVIVCLVGALFAAALGLVMYLPTRYVLTRKKGTTA